MRIVAGTDIALKAVQLAGCALAALALPTLAQAQDAAGPDGAGIAEGGEEIIVTARRREENVQDVPAAIQVLSGTMLEQRNIRSEQDLATAAPGLLVRSNNN